MTTTQRTRHLGREERRPASSLEAGVALAGLQLDPIPPRLHDAGPSPSAVASTPTTPTWWGRIIAAVVALVMTAVGGYQIIDGGSSPTVAPEPVQADN